MIHYISKQHVVFITFVIGIIDVFLYPVKSNIVGYLKGETKSFEMVWWTREVRDSMSNQIINKEVFPVKTLHLYLGKI